MDWNVTGAELGRTEAGLESNWNGTEAEPAEPELDWNVTGAELGRTKAGLESNWNGTG
ncbi:hypothetical protein [Paenibacillus sp. IHB B 3415]|uniref:hypothetical protein n=1 Tax=Paenibacillus sp. IHB B 3415 TaxID=867080 RepID=UPI000AB1BD9D|nr:hypothetical protein [Paenibacillus sp. IHB B 3415]